MTASGEDILAWLNNAITAREEVARRATQKPWRTHDTHLDQGGHTATVLAGERNDTELLAWVPTMSHQYWDETRNAWNNAEHIAANDPASVLRRCAADRKLIESLKAVIAGDYIDDGEPVLAEHVLQLVAEGYGWTGGER